MVKIAHPTWNEQSIYISTGELVFENRKYYLILTFEFYLNEKIQTYQNMNNRQVFNAIVVQGVVISRIKSSAYPLF